MTKRCRLWIWSFALLAAAGPSVALLAADASGPRDAARPAEESAASDAQIAKLIEQLGAADFAQREQAQAELSRFGLEAFDALLDAEKSDDIEIQLRARYLVSSMTVRWFADGDSPEVVRVLKGYESSTPPGEKRARMDRLAKLPDNQGLAALCRLTRFEIKPELSKKAALLVMNLAEPTDAEQRAAAAKTIVDTLGNSKRPAAAWLRTYAKTLENPESALAEWDSLVRAEQETLAHQPDQTTREVVSDLYRWQVALLQRLKHDDEAVAVIRRMINLLDGTPEQIVDIVDWLVAREAWDAVQEVADRFPGAFSENAQLLYRLAETQLKTNRKELAQQTADKALAIRPEYLTEHLIVAYQLSQRGLFDWSEKEYRMICEKAQPGSVIDFRARFFFSELLHDHGREKEAADALQPLADLMDKDEQAKGQAVSAGRDPEAIYARMRFFRALHAAEESQTDKARAEFLKALEYDDTDADVLISLYRLKNNPEQAADIKEKIERATEKYRAEIAEFTESLEGANIPQEKAIYASQVATSCNQFAWLVSNTFGDFDEALRASHRSLELKPDTAGYLDTLGRCYYAKGDLVNAVKYQRQAVKLDPHSLAIQRQLQLFEKELAEKGGGRSADAKPAAPPAEAKKS